MPAGCTVYTVAVDRRMAGDSLTGARPAQSSSTEQQQATDDQHSSSRAAMDAEGCRSGAALVKNDHGVTDRYDSGRQHKPTKRAYRSIGYENGDEQSRCDVSNTFR